MSWMERMDSPTFIAIIKGLYINQNKWEDVGYIDSVITYTFILSSFSLIIIDGGQVSLLNPHK